MDRVSKVSLSERRRQLVELLQELNFGRIEDLVIRDGQPVLNPPPHIIREVKFGGENGPRPERATADFRLKAQVIELFTYFDQMQDGTIDVIEVKHGLPFRMLVAEADA